MEPLRTALILTAVSLIGAPRADAIGVKIQHPCQETYLLEREESAQLPTSLGKVTIEVLEASQLDYAGHESGIKSIGGTPTGDAALEVISDRRMRAYGWCFTHNGVRPDKYPDEVTIRKSTAEVYWYFGFADYRNGEWVSYCNPTHEVQPAFICE